MPRRQYRRPIATFEHGTRVYAPSPGDPMYRVIARRADGGRVFYRLKTEEAARERAREIEASVVFSGSVPDRAGAPREVGHLVDRYVASLGSRSLRYRERQEYLLRMWVVPMLGTLPLRKWTPAKSEEVLDRASAVGTYDGAEHRLVDAIAGDVRAEEPVAQPRGRSDVDGPVQPDTAAPR